MVTCPRFVYTTVISFFLIRCAPRFLVQNAIEFIVKHAEVSAVMTADSKLAMLNKAMPRVKDGLKCIVYWPTVAGATEGMLLSSYCIVFYAWVLLYIHTHRQ